MRIVTPGLMKSQATVASATFLALRAPGAFGIGLSELCQFSGKDSDASRGRRFAPNGGPMMRHRRRALTAVAILTIATQCLGGQRGDPMGRAGARDRPRCRTTARHPPAGSMPW